MKSGNINVQTENIFPIIKKFLYSDHEIFLRELVSNGVDAIQKLKKLASLGEHNEAVENPMVEVRIDKENGQLIIEDNGIGMTAGEVEKYINQIAFSGAEEFVQKYKDKEGASAGIIGHFGLGFYSAFMVAEKVEIFTRSYQPDAKAVHWSCDGSPNYELSETEKEERGTRIVLHIDEDSKEFLEESRVSGILHKYCQFLPVPIKFGTREETSKNDKDEEVKTTVDNIINNPTPAWVKAPTDLKDEDYQQFYRELYPMAEAPLFHIHINVDYPFNLTGILYFPKLRNQIDLQKNKIQLYCNQVFVTDSVEGVVPEFLTLLHGVLDSPDIPLNVSRSYLQSDSNVKKISGHISKKVADKLTEMFKNDRAEFERLWEDLKVFIEYGILTDEKFYDRVKDIILVKQHGEEVYKTIEEWKEDLKPVQTDKDDRLVLLYTNEPNKHEVQIESALDKGYKVLQLEGPLSSHFISHIEAKHDKLSFARIDSDTLDQLIKKEEETPSKLSEKEQEDVKDLFVAAVDKEKYEVQVVSAGEKESPVQITQTEFMRRMKEQQAVGGMNFFGEMPEKYVLNVNANHELVGQLLQGGEGQAEKVRYLVDLARLSSHLLDGKDLSSFIKKSLHFLQTEKTEA